MSLISDSLRKVEENKGKRNEMRPEIPHTFFRKGKINRFNYISIKNTLAFQKWGLLLIIFAIIIFLIVYITPTKLLLKKGTVQPSKLSSASNAAFEPAYRASKGKSPGSIKRQTKPIHPNVYTPATQEKTFFKAHDKKKMSMTHSSSIPKDKAKGKEIKEKIKDTLDNSLNVHVDSSPASNLSSSNKDYKEIEPFSDKTIISSSQKVILDGFQDTGPMFRIEVLEQEDSKQKKDKRDIEYPKFSAADYNNLGIAFYYRGEFKEALENINKAIQLNPDNFQSYVNLGIIYKKQNNFEKALMAYNHAISLQPNAPDPYYNMGILFDDLGRVQDATKAYRLYLVLATQKSEDIKKKVKARINFLESEINVTF